MLKVVPEADSPSANRPASGGLARLYHEGVVVELARQAEQALPLQFLILL
jgi:hypothetical protein